MYLFVKGIFYHSAFLEMIFLAHSSISTTYTKTATVDIRIAIVSGVLCATLFILCKLTFVH
jgi:hypothetical protein